MKLQIIMCCTMTELLLECFLWVGLEAPPAQPYSFAPLQF